MLKKIYIAFIILLLAPALLHAQDKKRKDRMEKARQEYSHLRYASAIVLLRAELKNDPQNIEAQELIADSYRLTKDYDNALVWYARLTQAQNTKPQWALYYAEALANKQQYAAAEQWYQNYLKLMSQDADAAGFAKFYLNVDDFLKNHNEWDISYLNINTAASEYSPMFYQKGLVFSSNRKQGTLVKKVFGWDQTPFSDLYYVEDRSTIKKVDPDRLASSLKKNMAEESRKHPDNDDYTPATSNDTYTLGNYNPKFLNDTLGGYFAKQVKVEPLPGNINTQYHEGSAAAFKDGSIIFTRNNYYKGEYKTAKDGINKLKMFTAKAPDFKDIEPFLYNSNDYSVGHPALNSSGTLLIFASDMPGGYGGSDLYYCVRNSVNLPWQKPVNMGPVINTKGNELFPTLYNNTLYFSSTGHPGLGGLDIFQVALNNDYQPLHKPVNLGSPVNSSVDDFGLIRNVDGTTGYFTSNRRGSDDIYSFTHRSLQIKLHGVVMDSLTNEVICYNTIFIRPVVDQVPETDNLCSFDNLLKPETVYQVTATNDGYSTAIRTFSTKGIYNDTTINIVLKIHPVDPIRKMSSVAQRKNKPASGCAAIRSRFAINKIYFDLDKSLIREDARTELDRVIAIMEQHPELKIVVASYCDSRETKAYNMALSGRRSQSVKDYLIAHGIDAIQIFTEHFGENNLVTDCPDGAPCTEAQHQLNRRSELFLIKGGKKIMNMDCSALERAFGDM